MPKKHRRVLLICALLGWLLSIGTPGSAAEQKPLARPAIGRVTFEGGKPLTGDIQDTSISFSGISEAGEKIYHAPVVKNGAYRQKLVAGHFRSGPGTIKVKFFGDGIPARAGSSRV